MTYKTTKSALLLINSRNNGKGNVG